MADPSQVIANTGSIEWRQSEPKTIELYNTDRGPKSSGETYGIPNELIDALGATELSPEATSRDATTTAQDEMGEKWLAQQREKFGEFPMRGADIPEKPKGEARKIIKHDMRDFDKMVQKYGPDAEGVHEMIHEMIGTGMVWMTDDGNLFSATGPWSKGSNDRFVQSVDSYTDRMNSLFGEGGWGATPTQPWQQDMVDSWRQHQQEQGR